jgi:hypothetical protein
MLNDRKADPAAHPVDPNIARSDSLVSQKCQEIVEKQTTIIGRTVNSVAISASDLMDIVAAQTPSTGSIRELTN